MKSMYKYDVVADKVNLKYNNIIVDISCKNIDWEAFLKSNEHEFYSLIRRFDQLKYEEDYIWLIANNNTFFLLGLLWDEISNIGIGSLSRIDPFDDNNLYWRHENSNKKKNDYAIMIYENLRVELPNFFPFFYKCYLTDKKNKVLVVKLPKASQNIRLLPFDSFSECNLGAFGRYYTTNFIISDRSFEELMIEKIQNEKLYRNHRYFISKTAIFINFYKHHYLHPDHGNEIEKISLNAIEIFQSIEKCFTNVDFNGERNSLRFYFNAKPEVVLTELISPETWFFIGNFHTVPYYSEDNEILFKWALDEGENSNFYFDILNLRLVNIKKMILFHCNSGKNGKESIISRLLNTGAKYVEGSIDKEDNIDYLAFLINIFLNERTLFLENYDKQNNAHLVDNCNEFIKIINQFKNKKI